MIQKTLNTLFELLGIYSFSNYSDPHRTAVILDALVREQPAYMRQLAVKAGLPEETL